MTTTVLDHDKYINRSFIYRILYRVFGKHDWLYNKTRTRRWCRVSDRQERKTANGWCYIDQPKRAGFI